MTSCTILTLASTLCLSTLFLSFSSSFAWSPPPSSQSSCSSSLQSENDCGHYNRRNMLQQTLFGSATAVMVGTTLPFVQPASAAASLLEEFGADPKVIVQKKQDATTTTTITAKKGEAAIDPTLRASYYYPTAKKRYLPRILKVSNGIPTASSAVQLEDWNGVDDFYKNADNAILPLKLYVSSLDGQGLGMTNQYAIQMKKESTKYEQQVALLKTAIGKQNKEMALSAISEMGVAMTEYRQIGKLTDDDGNIPSVDEMRRMAMRKPTIAIASNQ